MPSRSSRSRPDSLTSLSDPTGSASLAIAMGARTLTIRNEVPVVVLADLPEAAPGGLVAEGAVDAGLVERAGIETEGGGSLIVPAEVGVEHRGIVGRDRAADAGGREARQRMLGERADGSRAEV